jgi:hypothetical protein
MGQQSRAKWERRTLREVAIALAKANPKMPLMKKLWGWPVVSVVASLFLGFGFTASLTDEYGMADGFYAFGSVLLLVKFLWWEETKNFPDRKRIGISMIAVVSAFLIFCGGLSINQLRKAHVASRQAAHPTSPQLPPPLRGDYMESRGPTDRYGSIKIEHWKVVKGIASSDIIADGNLLTEYADQFRLIGLCLHYTATADYKDYAGISKSAVIDIRRGLVTLTIRWNEQFIREVASGERGTTYVLLLVPKSMTPADFNTEREAISKGAYELQVGGGEP